MNTDHFVTINSKDRKDYVYNNKPLSRSNFVVDIFDKHEISKISISSILFTNSIPNILDTYQFSWTDSNGSHSFNFPKGIYNIDQLVEYIQTEMRLLSNHGGPSQFVLSYNSYTGKITFTGDNTPWSIDFTNQEPLAKILGFEAQIYTSVGQSIESVNVVNLSYNIPNYVTLLTKFNSLTFECVFPVISSGYDSSFLDHKNLHYQDLDFRPIHIKELEIELLDENRDHIDLLTDFGVCYKFTS